MGNNSYSEKIIISLGGSLIVPQSGIDTHFLSQFNTFIRDQLTANPHRQFFLVCGGGSTARQYIAAGKSVIGENLTLEDEDWLGIHATRLNAHLIRTIFYDVAHPHIIEHYDIIRKATEPIVVASGWKPGWSTDFDAVLLCEDYGAKTIINLSNVDQVYDKDPRQFPDAKPIDKIAWSEFRKLVPEKWSPGLNAPFDPVAAEKAEAIGVKVVVLNGKNLENLQKYLSGGEFVGTVIE